jgi:hypothetical protein
LKLGTAAAARINNLSKRLDYLDGDTGNGNGNGYAAADDHDYYLDRGMEPPRFAYCRQVRIERCTDERRKRSLECVNDSITHDELDYYLKARLRVPPEQRYQRIRKEPWFHDGSWYMRDQSKGYDGHGCNQFTGCVPECRYYPEYGRIEDEEVIVDHNKWVESYRQGNAIVEPSTLLEQQQHHGYNDDESNQPQK